MNASTLRQKTVQKKISEIEQMFDYLSRAGRTSWSYYCNKELTSDITGYFKSKGFSIYIDSKAGGLFGTSIGADKYDDLVTFYW
jgi:tetrahydromethanopterin S-methyltransferase subunit B